MEFIFVSREGVDFVNMQEMTRLMEGLKKMGLTEKQIYEFLLYIESGNEKYEPKKIIVDE